MQLSEFVNRLCASSTATFEKFGLRQGLPQPEREKWLGDHYLPICLADLFSQFDGQEKEAAKLLGEFRLLSFNRATKFWIEKCEDQSQLCVEYSEDARIKSGIKWRHLWFPFAWDVDSNSDLLVDFEPSNSGNPGQIVLYRYDSDPIVVAENFGALLLNQFDKLTEQGFELDEFGTMGRFISF